MLSDYWMVEARKQDWKRKRSAGEGHHPRRGRALDGEPKTGTPISSAPKDCGLGRRAEGARRSVLVELTPKAKRLIEAIWGRPVKPGTPRLGKKGKRSRPRPRPVAPEVD